MAKTYTWTVEDTVLNEETGESEAVTHTVSLKCSLTWGKAIVTIDGTEFDISTRPFALRGTSQMFRLGDSPAMLNFPKRGKPTVTVDGKELQ